MTHAAGYALPKTARLREGKIFRELLASRQKISTPFFVVKYIKSTLPHSRLAVTPPKKKFAA